MKKKSGKLDNLDMQIMSRLLNNCRESNRQIGQALDVSGGTVHSRIEGMLEDGVIKRFVLRVEPPVLGYGAFYAVLMGKDMDEALEQMRLIGEPFMIAPCIGGTTAYGIAVKEGVAQKIELAKSLMREMRVLCMLEAQDAETESDLTRTDIDVMAELARNPRERTETVAESIGISSKTVARCIEKMQRDERIQFTLIYDPKKMGGFIPYAILVWISGAMDATLAILKKRFGAYFLQAPFLAKNQVGLFMYSDSIFKIDEMAEKVRAVKGVSSTDLFIPKSIAFPDEWQSCTISELQKSPRFRVGIPAE